jgi:hypothetical protein
LLAGGSVAGRVAGAACLVAALVAAGPRAAGAALALANSSELSCTPGDHFFDLVFTETAPAENEGLFAYDLALTATAEGPGGGFAFTGAAAPADGFVFDVPGGALFRVAEVTPGRLVINVASNGELADVASGDKAARVFYTIGATPPAAFTLAFDPGATDFLSADPDRPIDIPVSLVDPGTVVCPEPGGVGVVLAVAGGVTLARRRRRP